MRDCGPIRPHPSLHAIMQLAHRSISPVMRYVLTRLAEGWVLWEHVSRNQRRRGPAATLCEPGSDSLESVNKATFEALLARGLIRYSGWHLRDGSYEISDAGRAVIKAGPSAS